MVTLFKRVEGNFKDPRICLIWSKRLSVLFSALSFNLVREISSYLTPNYLLADLRKNSLRFLNVRTQTRTPQVSLHFTIALSLEFSRWIVLNSGKVVCCGGKSRKDWLATTYLIGTNGTVEKKPSLLKARGAQGLMQWREFVLLFGGDHNGPLVECESLLLPNGRCWQVLPSMAHGKHSFNPCLLHDIIYLYGYGSETLEGFSPRQNSYLPLDIHFEKLANCCLYVNRDYLVIISPTLLVRYRPGEEGTSEENRIKGACFSKTQNCQPVVDEVSRRVFGLNGGKCWSFDMDIGESTL